MLLYVLLFFIQSELYGGYCYSPIGSTGACPSNLIQIENISQCNESNPEINTSIDTIQLYLLSYSTDDIPIFSLSSVTNFKLHILSNSFSLISIVFDNKYISLQLSNIAVYFESNENQLNLNSLNLSNVHFYHSQKAQFLSMTVNYLFSDLDSIANTTKIQCQNPILDLTQEYHYSNTINLLLISENQREMYTLIGFSQHCILKCEEKSDTISFDSKQQIVITKSADVANFVTIVNQTADASIDILATSSQVFAKNDFIGQPHFTLIFNTSNIEFSLPSFTFADSIGCQFQFKIHQHTANNCLIRLNKLVTAIEIIEDLQPMFQKEVMNLHLILDNNLANIYHCTFNCPFNINVDTDLNQTCSLSISTLNCVKHNNSNFIIQNDKILVSLNTMIIDSSSGGLSMVGSYQINGRINAYSNTSVEFSSLIMKNQLLIHIYFDIYSQPFISVTNGNTRNELITPLEVIFSYIGHGIPLDKDCLNYLQHNTTVLQLGNFSKDIYYVHLDSSVDTIGFSEADSVVRFVYDYNSISFYFIGFPSVIYSYICYGDNCSDYFHHKNENIPYIVFCNKTTISYLVNRLQWFTKSFTLYLVEEMVPDYVLNLTSNTGDDGSVRTNPISFYIVSLFGKTKLTLTFSELISKYVNMFYLQDIYTDVPNDTPKGSLNCMFNWMQLGATTNFSEKALQALNFDKIKNVAVDVQSTPYVDLHMFKQTTIFLTIDRQNYSYFTFENNSHITIDDVTVSQDSRLLYYVFTPFVIFNCNHKKSIRSTTVQTFNLIDMSKITLKQAPVFDDYFELKMFLANDKSTNIIFEGEWPISSNSAAVLYGSFSNVINVYSESSSLPLSIITATDFELRIGNLPDKNNTISSFIINSPLMLMNNVIKITLIDAFTHLTINNFLCSDVGGRVDLEGDRVHITQTLFHPLSQCTVNNGAFTDSIQIYHGAIASFNLSDLSTLHKVDMMFYSSKFPTLMLRGIPSPNHFQGNNNLPRRINIKSSVDENVTATSGSYHIITGNIVRCSELVEDKVLYLNTTTVNDGNDTVKLQCGDGGDVLLVISENGEDGDKAKNRQKFIILIVVASFVLIVLIVTFVVIFYVKKKNENPENKYYDISTPLTSDSLEISKSAV